MGQNKSEKDRVVSNEMVPRREFKFFKDFLRGFLSRALVILSVEYNCVTRLILNSIKSKNRFLIDVLAGCALLTLLMSPIFAQAYTCLLYTSRCV